MRTVRTPMSNLQTMTGLRHNRRARDAQSPPATVWRGTYESNYFATPSEAHVENLKRGVERERKTRGLEEGERMARCLSGN